MNIFTHLIQNRKGQSTISLYASSRNSGMKMPSFLEVISMFAWLLGCLFGFCFSAMLFSILHFNNSAYHLMFDQSYDSKFLKIYPELQPTPLQLEEDLEQLKVLENGYKMKVLYRATVNLPLWMAWPIWNFLHNSFNIARLSQSCHLFLLQYGLGPRLGCFGNESKLFLLGVTLQNGRVFPIFFFFFSCKFFVWIENWSQFYF